jgi:hypothetical protein
MWNKVSIRIPFLSHRNEERKLIILGFGYLKINVYYVNKSIILYLTVLGFELRASGLLGRHSTT